jgi:hypothetical protein
MLVFVGASVVTGRTEKEAHELLAEYRHHASVESALVHAAASLGIDFARYGVDEPIEAGDTQAIRSNVEAITASLGSGWSKRRLIDRFVLGSRQPPPGRLARAGGGPADRLGDRGRCGWLQSLPHGCSGVFGELYRSGGTGSAGARRL